MSESNNDRHDADLLLPWFVNDSLTPEEQSQVNVQLHADADLVKEAEFLNNLRGSVRSRTTATPGEFGWRRLQRDIRREQKSSPTVNKWWLPALAAAALVILVQGGVLLNMLSGPATYEPAGVQTPGTVLQVRFQDNATAAQIAQLLKDIDGSVIEGPSAVGLFRIRLTEKADADKVVSKIKQSPNVVEYVAAE